MISNFQIRKDASLPWLEVVVTKNGQVPIAQQAPSYECSESSTDPNALDLTDVASVSFELYKCNRIPQKVAVAGTSEVVDATNGVVRYKWKVSDTQESGLYYGSFILNFNDGSMLKWPYQLEALTIEIMP